MSHVVIVTGIAGTGKTRLLLDEYLASLERARSEQRPGTTLWLTPNRRVQKTILQSISSKSGHACFAPNVLTFDLFAEKILEAAGRPATPISPVMKRLLLRRIVERLVAEKELKYFASIASTTGFLDVCSSFIAELKRDEVWPEHFVDACQGRKSAFARRDTELGLIYERYQHHLADQNWYDNEGRFWLARSALEDPKNRGAFAKVQFAAVDGFADFTKTQYEILGYLAGWIDRLMISLPVENPLERRELFAKPHAAIERILEQLPKQTSVQIERLSTTPDSRAKSPREDVNWAPAIRTIATQQFANPRYVKASVDATGLEVIAATGQMGEWEAVALRIKKLLSAQSLFAFDDLNSRSKSFSVRPQEIVIGLRSIADDGPRLCEYLKSAGVPVWCEAGTPLETTAIVKAVMAVWQLELEDWPFERLMAVLDSSYFQPQWPERRDGQAVRAVSAFLRHVNISSGRELILRAVTRYAAESDTRKGSLTRMAQLAAPLLNRLSRTLEQLRRSHTLDDWADILSTIAEELGWSSSSATGRDLFVPGSTDLDLLQRILRTAGEADRKLAGKTKPKKLDLTQFAAELRDLLSHEALKPTPEPGGTVRILSVEQLRNLDIPYLFLMGMTETSFPSNRTDDCLFSEAERLEFIARGVPLRHRTADHADEMLLFYSITTRARRRLTLSYPAVNSSGQEVYPSTYVTALLSLFDKKAVTWAHEGQLDPVPRRDRALTLTDLRLLAVTEAREGKPELFRLLLEDPLRSTSCNTLAACDVAHQRFEQHGFTAYEGRLELPRNLAVLQSRFGMHHQFSATELEAYARCPFQFWLSTVLKVGAIESPEEGTDHAARGTLLHDVVAQLLSEQMLDGSEETRARFRELVDLQLERQYPETDLQRSLIQIERTILSEWSDAFVEQQGMYGEKLSELLKEMSSFASEIPFGNLPDRPVADERSYPPIQFGRDENAVKLRGRIDRVDVGRFEGKPAYVVVDYKTGRRPTSNDRELISGRSIQLALYLIAIKQLGLVGPEAIPVQMGYWILQETGFKPGFGSRMKALEPEKIRWMESVLHQLLPQLASEIRSGRFVVENEDESCTSRCAFRTVCRVNQIRPLIVDKEKYSPSRLVTEIEEADETN